MQLWLTVTIASILPLLAAIGYAAYALQQQTDRQGDLLKKMDLVNRNSAEVGEHVKELVRLSRQYALLQEASFRKLYLQKHESLRKYIANLRELLVDERSQRMLEDLQRTSENVRTAMQSTAAGRTKELASSLELFVALSKGISRAAEEHRGQSLRDGEQEFNRIVRHLFLLTALTLPITVLLMIGGTYYLSRPMWRLNQAIHSLAEQNWDEPIEVHGPADLAALGENLEWMRNQIIASDRQKSAFMQHITHELKTPIAAIIEAGDLMVEEVSGPLDAKQHAILKILRTNANHLEKLIQKLLNYNAVSHGIVTRWEEIDLQAICRSIRAYLESSSPGKQVHWEFSGDTETVCTDPRLIQMILDNLLGNAFAFVPEQGRISVRWKVLGPHWELSVDDNGPGIEPTELANIFTPFYMGTAGRKHKQSSTGIGLSIVKECVNLLKGEVHAKSHPGRGANFSMVFPTVNRPYREAA